MFTVVEAFGFAVEVLLLGKWKSDTNLYASVREREADLDEGVEVPFPEIFIPR